MMNIIPFRGFCPISDGVSRVSPHAQYLLIPVGGARFFLRVPDVQDTTRKLLLVQSITVRNVTIPEGFTCKRLIHCHHCQFFNAHAVQPINGL